MTEKSFFDRGDGLPVFWDAFRDQAIEGLKEWVRRNDGERRIAEACKLSNMPGKVW